ncbi:hypothetical protein V1264_012397 [Littorina saxatilis]|uniref:G-protein coupled receptors family 1 profile domain-containing protein n=2 Tax=Littorina saxatilis TaxID=31220 RepID=A0AAN9BUU9_9CAEN
MMMTVVGIYSTCWLPLHTITILGDTNPFIWHNPGIRYVWLSAHWLAMSSCMYNPLIYWWMSERFRGGYKFLLKSIKYQCCTCGHDSLMRMSGRPELHFQSSYSQAGDYATGAPPPPPMPIYRNTAQGGRGVGVNGGGEGGGGNVEGGGGGGSRNGREGSGRGRWMEEDRKHKQNGFIFCHDLHADKGETIPLKKTSETLESGLGSEDGGDGEETRPAYL